MCKVMSTAGFTHRNKQKEIKILNGEVGTVKSFKWIEDDKGKKYIDKVVVVFDSHDDVPITVGRIEERMKNGPKVMKLHLQPAYAFTYHKAPGRTMDLVIPLTFENGKCHNRG